MSNPFIQIYQFGGWNAMGSGPGSQPDYNTLYCWYLEHFLRSNDIRSVVDFGCGDWSFSRLVDWSGIDYTGIDCVPQLIERNKALYEKGNVRFRLNAFEDLTYPACDLLIAKDVMQHWSHDRTRKFLAVTRQTPFVLFVNDIPDCDNLDILDGGYHPVDLRKPPFGEIGTVVFCFRRQVFNKVAFLQRHVEAVRL